jgi:hypothetical protein
MTPEAFRDKHEDMMNFQEIAARFEQAASGSDSFKTLYKEAFQMMKADQENAGLYFVVGIAAQSYVRNFEDQGVTRAFSDNAQATLAGYNRKIVDALSADAATRLKVLGEISVDYEWNLPDF